MALPRFNYLAMLVPYGRYDDFQGNRVGGLRKSIPRIVALTGSALVGDA